MRKIILFLILFVLFIGFLPILFSTIGKPLFESLSGSRLHGKIKIEKASFSWTGPQVFDRVTFTNSEVSASIDHFESPVPFWKLAKIDRTFALQGGSFTFPTYNGQIINTEATIQDHTLEVKAKTPQGGSLEIQATIVSKVDFHIVANLQEIPTIAIDHFLQFENSLSQALGPTLNLHGSFTQNGISFDLSSSQATASLKASIANGILTLRAPFKTSLLLSDAFRETLQKQISPNLITEFNIKNPVTLIISPDGFQLPLPFHLDQIQIGNGQLDIGQSQVKSGDSLHFLMTLFKNKDFGKTFEMWFTPITFSMKSGTILLDRIDVLLGKSVHLCTWGEIHLQKEKLRMTLGIPADTLKQSFEIETLTPNYVLTIPVKGTLQNPKFETGPAVAKIAAMAASQQIPTKGGKIFGNAVNIFAQTQDDQDIPPPKKPFPWEK